MSESAVLTVVTPANESGFLPSPANDFDYIERETHTVGWVTAFMDDLGHEDFAYTVSVCHVYPEHDGYAHRADVVTDDDVHYLCLCDCCPDYELVDGDATRLLVKHRDMRYGEEPMPREG